MSIFLAFLFACDQNAVHDQSAEAERYAAALRQVSERPEDARAICAPIERAVLRQECMVAGAESVARSSPALGQALCEDLASGLFRDECFFQVAERTSQPELCQRAGRFSEDCRMHVWSTTAARHLRSAVSLADEENTLAQLATASGFSADDPRPWVAVGRVWLGKRTPMNRADCNTMTEDMHQQACRLAGRGLYIDRLNHARDTHTFPCDGGPLPSVLQTEPDPELAAIRSERREQDLCP